ncbi:hypothetical protein P8452_05584 [Trifolium repens]|nr:hypothetical protein P8452_05584 [Trifolium repens]
MAHVFIFNRSAMKATVYLFFLILTTTFLISNSARILGEMDSQEPQVINNLPLPLVTNPSLTTTIPNTTPQTGPDISNKEANADPPIPEVEASTVDNVSVSQKPQPVAKQPSLSFFMHDILGGSHPSSRVVTGIVANSDVTGLPFSKQNNNIFPITGGIPLVNPKLNGIITNNNLPLLVGLGGGQSSTVFQNRGTNNVVTGGNNQPFVSVGNLPGGFTVQKLMFGSVMVIDDQLTEGHGLGSNVVGRIQGFYTASSLDGTSQSVVMTMLLHGDNDHDGVDDSISLFGIHRTASPKSKVAVIGGTGKYENARGYAALETLLKEDQHTTDGVDTILHFNLYLTH